MSGTSSGTFDVKRAPSCSSDTGGKRDGDGFGLPIWLQWWHVGGLGPDPSSSSDEIQYQVNLMCFVVLSSKPVFFRRITRRIWGKILSLSISTRHPDISRKTSPKPGWTLSDDTGPSLSQFSDATTQRATGTPIWCPAPPLNLATWGAIWELEKLRSDDLWRSGFNTGMGLKRSQGSFFSNFDHSSFSVFEVAI